MERKFATKPSYLTEADKNKMKGVQDRQIRKLLMDSLGKLGQAKNYMGNFPADYAQEIEDINDIIKLFKRDFKSFGIK